MYLGNRLLGAGQLIKLGHAAQAGRHALGCARPAGLLQQVRASEIKQEGKKK